MMKKYGTKILMDIYKKPADSKRYVPLTSKYPRHCLTNITFPLTRRICTIVENENVKAKWLKKLKKILLEQKYRKSLKEASILRAKKTPWSFKATKNNQKLGNKTRKNG